MGPTPLSREREVAIAAATAAAKKILAIYATDFAVDFKDSEQDDPVTAADRGANASIVAAIAQAFPDDVIVSEESEVPAGFSEKRRCWFVDPLDGTKEFVAKNGEFCVMIGLAIEGRAALGVVHVPALAAREGEQPGFVMVGEVGQGAFLLGHEDRALRLSTPADLRKPAIVTSRSRRSPALDAIFANVGEVREVQCGSVGVKIARMLLGDADGYVHVASRGTGPKLWDLCAPDAIVSAAGGLFTDGDGARIDYSSPEVAHHGGMVVGAPALHRVLVDAVARARAANPR